MLILSQSASTCECQRLGNPWQEDSDWTIPDREDSDWVINERQVVEKGTQSSKEETVRNI